MKLSVVILNYNVQYFLEQCLLSVQRAINNIEGEIIVIDNASSDESCDMVRTKFPKVHLIENKKNVGFSKANNQAVKEAKGEYVCILNPDTAVAEDTFRNCLQFAENNNKVGAIGVYLLDGTGNFLPESKRNLPTPKASLLKMLKFTKKYYAQHINEEQVGVVPVLVGAFMFLKKEIYDHVNGFDEAYFMYGEDIDLSYKISKAGYSNYYLGTAQTLHYKGESTNKDAAYLDRFHNAMKIFYKKHYKKNVFLDRSVDLGVGLAKRLKKKSIAQVESNVPRPEQALLLTDNLDLLKKLSNRIEIPLRSSSKSIFQDGDVRNSLIIFDSEYMPYSQIFSVMRQFKNRNNHFRIRPPGCNFIVGSDKSDDKGEILHF